MKAAVYYETGGPEVFRYEEVSDLVCHPRGIVIGVEAISIEGGDVLHRAGGELVSRPHIVGYQCGGTVVEGGEAVAHIAPGHRGVAALPHCSHSGRGPLPPHARRLGPEGLGMPLVSLVPVAT